MNEQSMARADFITSVLLVAFGLFVVATALSMPTYADRGRNAYSAPGIVPGFLGTVITFLGATLLVRSIRRGGHRLDGAAAGARALVAGPSGRRVLTTLGISILYASVLIGRIPYALATALYVASFILIFEYDRTKRLAEQWRTIALAVGVAVTAAVLVTVTFQYLFLVTPP